MSFAFLNISELQPQPTQVHEVHVDFTYPDSSGILSHRIKLKLTDCDEERVVSLHKVVDEFNAGLAIQEKIFRYSMRRLSTITNPIHKTRGTAFMVVNSLARFTGLCRGMSEWIGEHSPFVRAIATDGERIKSLLRALYVRVRPSVADSLSIYLRCGGQAARERKAVLIDVAVRVFGCALEVLKTTPYKNRRVPAKDQEFLDNFSYIKPELRHLFCEQMFCVCAGMVHWSKPTEKLVNLLVGWERMRIMCSVASGCDPSPVTYYAKCRDRLPPDVLGRITGVNDRVLLSIGSGE